MRSIAGLDGLEGRQVVVSVSGGKDSAAMAAALQDYDIDTTLVFLDTGWEHPDTYAYLRGPLSQRFGPIVEVVPDLPELDEEMEAHAVRVEAMLGWHSAMVRLCLLKGMFPSRQKRWCTQVLKVFAMRDYLRVLDDHAQENLGSHVANAVGIRREESESRAQSRIWEPSKTYGIDVWRPIALWSGRDVIEAHHELDVPVNPLYLRGASRVGCWPCIHARKAEIANLDDPRIDVLRELERVVGDAAERRAVKAGTTLEEKGHRRPTWFQSQLDDRRWIACTDCRPELLDDDGCFALGPDLSPACETCGGTGKVRTKGTRGEMWPIDRTVAWSREDGPDMQTHMFGGEGCMRWGLCS